MALHLEYRADTLDDIVGNDIVIKTIKSIFERDKKDLPHCWLFIGPGGTGKTTTARIISKMLGCEPNPNNQDFQEINAASKGGVDTAREVENTMRYMPINKNSKARVYLFEEVHRSSDDFRKAMLNKCMEFTPEHVYLIFCTTNPEKLGKPNGPFRRRCHTFEMEKLKNEKICELVWKIIDDEGVRDYFNDEIVNAIAEEADGSAGAALNFLDRIIDLDTEDMLPAIKLSEQAQKQTIDLCRALLNGSWKDVAGVLKELNEDSEKVRHAVNGYMQAVILKQGSPKADIFLQALLVLNCFAEPNFYNGKPGLTKCCADVFS